VYIERTAERPLEAILAGDKVGIVLGARQVGKTTLVEHLFQTREAGRGALFLNFDLEVDKARFLAAAALPPADALRSLGTPPILVVDELAAARSP
jgi:predicted AAA+ superfamily ATPase